MSVGPVRPVVLVVEDDADFRAVTVRHLVEDGFDVREAESAGNAWELARAAAPHAIVMDLHLPGIDGQTLARQLRHRLGSRVVLVAFTSLPIDRVETSVFDAILEKPDLVALARALRRLLGSQQAAPSPA